MSLHFSTCTALALAAFATGCATKTLSVESIAAGAATHADATERTPASQASAVVPTAAFAGATASTTAADDAHNHDGSHPDSPLNCGSNYMLPGEVARLGSHSFVILGQEDQDHVLVDHRSGTPPHNYHFVLRVRLDAKEMDAYKNILKDSKTLPAFTTIYYDGMGEQKDRTFFCLRDLPKIFGAQQRAGDEFEKLFPIRASLQKNADHEGSFPIKASVVKGQAITLERKDVEIVFAKYLPSYLPQDTLRAAIKARPQEVVPLLKDAPVSQNEPRLNASTHPSYMSTEGSIGLEEDACAHDYYLKNTAVPKTIHTFLLLAETGKNTVLAIHYYDMAPQNYQTALRLHLTDEDMRVYRAAKDGTKTPPMYQTRIVFPDGAPAQNSYFCMSDLRDQIKAKKFSVQGTVYRDSGLDEYKLGTPVGPLALDSSNVEVLLNRSLNSLLNPVAVAKDVLGK